MAPIARGRLSKDYSGAAYGGAGWPPVTFGSGPGVVGVVPAGAVTLGGRRAGLSWEVGCLIGAGRGRRGAILCGRRVGVRCVRT
jgi:hypothetical protein